MRILVIQKPTWVSIDGIRVDRFEVGHRYEVGSQLGGVFLAEGWAIPVPLEEAAAVELFSERDPLAPRPVLERGAPPNLHREHFPSMNEHPAVAHEFQRRRRTPRK